MTIAAQKSGPSLIGYRPSSSPGFNQASRAILNGVPIIQPRRDQTENLRLLQRHAATDAFLSPYNFKQLIEAARTTDQLPTTLQQVTVGGGSLSPQAAIEAESLFGCPVYNSYGSGETGSISKFRVAELAQTPGVVGNIYDDMKIKFLAADGSQIDPSVGGEIVVNVPREIQVLDYPSCEPLCDADGWVKTGDLGHMLSDNTLCLTGRVSELLNIGGAKRSPSWFESIAARCDPNATIVAFGVPAKMGTDNVGIAVEAREDFNIQEFAQFMHSILGQSYVLQIGLVDRIPVNDAGKVDRQALRDLFLDASDAP